MRSASLVLFFIMLFHGAQAQLVDGMDNESKLYAETKQVNQFFRRFNGEEDEKGERYYPGHKRYRNTQLRKQYLSLLFDGDNDRISPALKTQFAGYVLDESSPRILNFHGGNWFSEVHTTFLMNGKEQPVILFMTLEKDHLGSKWVISRAFVPMFEPYFGRDTTRIGRFLHPLSHELDFMNLRKAFTERDSVSQFTEKTFLPDHLTLFLYEITRGNLKFKTVNEVKFHFFQIDGWYFELARFNRPGYNTGWLIANLVQLKDDSEKDLLRKYLYYETH